MRSSVLVKVMRGCLQLVGVRGRLPSRAVGQAVTRIREVKNMAPKPKSRKRPLDAAAASEPPPLLNDDAKEARLRVDRSATVTSDGGGAWSPPPIPQCGIKCVAFVPLTVIDVAGLPRGACFLTPSRSSLFVATQEPLPTFLFMNVAP